jgi:hypothetical protein
LGQHAGLGRLTTSYASNPRTLNVGTEDNMTIIVWTN